MEIKTLRPQYIEECAALLMRAYNCSPWNNHWTIEPAKKYLTEFIETPRFAGSILLKQGIIEGAAFCHARTWQEGGDLYADEFYISPDHHIQGYGRELMGHIERFCMENGLESIVLLTDRDKPAAAFYKKAGFYPAEHAALYYKNL